VPRYITQEQADQVLAMIKRRRSNREISEATGVSTITVQRYRKMGAAARRPAPGPKTPIPLKQAMGRRYTCSAAAIRKTMGTLTTDREWETVQERTTTNKDGERR